MKACSRVATPRACTSAAGDIGRQHPAVIHQGNPVTARCLVHEMSGDENGHVLIARQVDQQLPELVTCQGIDP